MLFSTRSHQLCALDGSQTAKPRSQTHELIKSSMQGRGHLSFTVTWLRARYSTHTRTSPLFNSASPNSPPSQQEDNATHAHHTHHQTEKTWQRITFRTMQIYTSITATCVSSKPFACQGLTIKQKPSLSLLLCTSCRCNAHITLSQPDAGDRFPFSSPCRQKRGVKSSH